MKINIGITRENKIVDDFNIKEGFVVFSDCDNNIVGISSGWYDRGNLYIYSHQDGEWVGNWEDDYSFPVDEAIEKIKNWEREKQMEDLKIEIDKLLRDRVELYKSDEPIRFTDEVAGDKSSDGGEYGFYSTYYPTEIAGIYELYSSTTCEFDACGTGYEGLVILSQDRYHYLVEEEKKVLEEEII